MPDTMDHHDRDPKSAHEFRNHANGGPGRMNDQSTDDKGKAMTMDTQPQAKRRGPDQPPAKRQGLDPKIQDALGRAMRAYSADIISEPIPGRFISLLAQLEAKERQNG